jgi:glycosyltransferase involved in cell wall biosynthesis
MKINLIGNFFGSDGYSSHVRQLANALNNLDDIEVIVTTNKIQNWVRFVNDEELKMLNRDSSKCDINLFIGLPTFWPLYMCEDKPLIGFLVWEGDRIPAGWIETLADKRVTQVWVPSNHVKDAILNTISKDYKLLYKRAEEHNKELEFLNKIKVIPHGIDPKLFYPDKKEHEKFTFVANKGWPNSWRDRGGLSYLVKAYLEEFKKEDNVKMLVKINSAYGLNLDKNIKDLDIQNKNCPELLFLPQQIEYKDMNRVYNEGDCFVNTSLSDGFNLGCLEAQACGLPILTTSFGGQSDFCNEETGWILEEGEMKEVKWDLQYEGVSWKYPSIDEIRKKLRYVYEHQEEAKKKGLAALDNSKKWTWNNSALKVEKALQEIKL